MAETNYSLRFRLYMGWAGEAEKDDIIEVAKTHLGSCQSILLQPYYRDLLGAEELVKIFKHRLESADNKDQEAAAFFDFIQNKLLPDSIAFILTLFNEAERQNVDFSALFELLLTDETLIDQVYQLAWENADIAHKLLSNRSFQKKFRSQANELVCHYVIEQSQIDFLQSEQAFIFNDDQLPLVTTLCEASIKQTPLRTALLEIDALTGNDAFSLPVARLLATHAHDCPNSFWQRKLSRKHFEHFATDPDCQLVYANQKSSRCLPAHDTFSSLDDTTKALIRARMVASSLRGEQARFHGLDELDSHTLRQLFADSNLAANVRKHPLAAARIVRNLGFIARFNDPDDKPLASADLLALLSKHRDNPRFIAAIFESKELLELLFSEHPEVGMQALAINEVRDHCLEHVKSYSQNPFYLLKLIQTYRVCLDSGKLTDEQFHRALVDIMPEANSKLNAEFVSDAIADPSSLEYLCKHQASLLERVDQSTLEKAAIAYKKKSEHNALVALLEETLHLLDISLSCFKKPIGSPPAVLVRTPSASIVIPKVRGFTQGVQETSSTPSLRRSKSQEDEQASDQDELAKQAQALAAQWLAATQSQSSTPAVDQRRSDQPPSIPETERQSSDERSSTSEADQPASEARPFASEADQPARGAQAFASEADQQDSLSQPSAPEVTQRETLEQPSGILEAQLQSSQAQPKPPEAQIMHSEDQKATTAETEHHDAPAKPSQPRRASAADRHPEQRETASEPLERLMQTLVDHGMVKREGLRARPVTASDDPSTEKQYRFAEVDKKQTKKRRKKQHRRSRSFTDLEAFRREQATVPSEQREQVGADDNPRARFRRSQSLSHFTAAPSAAGEPKKKKGFLKKAGSFLKRSPSISALLGEHADKPSLPESVMKSKLLRDAPSSASITHLAFSALRDTKLKSKQRIQKIKQAQKATKRAISQQSERLLTDKDAAAACFAKLRKGEASEFTKAQLIYLACHHKEGFVLQHLPELVQHVQAPQSGSESLYLDPQLNLSLKLFKEILRKAKKDNDFAAQFVRIALAFRVDEDNLTSFINYLEHAKMTLPVTKKSQRPLAEKLVTEENNLGLFTQLGGSAATILTAHGLDFIASHRRKIAELVSHNPTACCKLLQYLLEHAPAVDEWQRFIFQLAGLHQESAFHLLDALLNASKRSRLRKALLNACFIHTSKTTEAGLSPVAMDFCNQLGEREMELWLAQDKHLTSRLLDPFLQRAAINSALAKSLFKHDSTLQVRLTTVERQCLDTQSSRLEKEKKALKKQCKKMEKHYQKQYALQDIILSHWQQHQAIIQQAGDAMVLCLMARDPKHYSHLNQHWDVVIQLAKQHPNVAMAFFSNAELNRRFHSHQETTVTDKMAVMLVLQSEFASLLKSGKPNNDIETRYFMTQIQLTGELVKQHKEDSFVLLQQTDFARFIPDNQRGELVKQHAKQLHQLSESERSDLALLGPWTALMLLQHLEHSAATVATLLQHYRHDPVIANRLMDASLRHNQQPLDWQWLLADESAATIIKATPWLRQLVSNQTRDKAGVDDSHVTPVAEPTQTSHMTQAASSPQAQDTVPPPPPPMPIIKPKPAAESFTKKTVSKKSSDALAAATTQHQMMNEMANILKKRRKNIDTSTAALTGTGDELDQQANPKTTLSQPCDAAFVVSRESYKNELGSYNKKRFAKALLLAKQDATPEDETSHPEYVMQFMRQHGKLIDDFVREFFNLLKAYGTTEPVSYRQTSQAIRDQFKTLCQDLIQHEAEPDLPAALDAMVESFGSNLQSAQGFPSPTAMAGKHPDTRLLAYTASVFRTPFQKAREELRAKTNPSQAKKSTANSPEELAKINQSYQALLTMDLKSWRKSIQLDITEGCTEEEWADDDTLGSALR